MAASLHEAVANGGSRTVQQRGVLTLPEQWREKHEFEQGGLVAVIENDDGHPEVIPPGSETGSDYPTPEHERSCLAEGAHRQPSVRSTGLATPSPVDAATYDLLINSDTRTVGDDRELYLPKDWCLEHGIELGTGKVVGREQDDGSLQIIPPDTG